MESPKMLNGLQIADGTKTGRYRSSKRVTPTLPSFVSRKSLHAPLAKGFDSLAVTWRQEPDQLDLQWRRRAAATAKAHARCRALGNLILAALLIVGGAMTVYALQREQQIQQLEQRQ